MCTPYEGLYGEAPAPPPLQKKRHLFQLGLRCTRGQGFLELKYLKGYENLLYSYLKGLIIILKYFGQKKTILFHFTLTFHNISHF